MEEKKFPTEQCAEFRAAFDPDPEQMDLELNPVLRGHADSCAGCKRWTGQIALISQHGKNMPQFDVPEAATQNVLAAVKGERKARAFQEAVIIAVLLVACAVVLFLFPIDSIDGTCSWLVSAAIVVGFGLLARGAGKLEMEAR